ncbi:ABC transporter ATP-binding protein [Cohnella sp. AR92]|uniref:ABC transporter ATP-binding protein n=1 Tax=Cohnella sp. AR92 TaxID=648716 RepID=UPI000F8D89FA|nr:ABC transporter ATP-binding protein [Cohnella sp. AR92]RUS43086.1 ABC transporter ATP-binding protein [Cohnella sp. AR92]
MLMVEGLTKKFPNGRGIEDISFEAKQGEAFGFLGPNGAGKSTTIRLIMGFMKPDRGHVTIDGLEARRHPEAVMKKVGYLPGEISFPEGMSGRAFLDFLASMQRAESRTKRDRLIERLQFDADTPIRKMSKGMKQKVGLVAALMHDPALVILDEPTTGLDPLMQKTFVELVLEEKKKGTTFLMSSHSFPEMERTCDRAAIIKNGRLAAVKDIHELRSLQRKLFELVFDDAEDALSFSRSGIGEAAVEGNRVIVAVQGGDDALIRAASRYSIRSIDIAAQNLEDVFMHYYDRKEIAP